MTSSDDPIAETVALQNVAVEIAIADNPSIQRQSDSAAVNNTSNSTPLAVLPLNSSTKLDQEPNPFEQSFSTAAAAAEAASTPTSAGIRSPTTKRESVPNTPAKQAPSPVSAASTSVALNRRILPPVAALTSPAGSMIGTAVLPKDVISHLSWDSLRTGPLSPSMLQGPANPSEVEELNVSSALMNGVPYISQPPPISRSSTHAAYVSDAYNATHGERSGSMSSATSNPSLTLKTEPNIIQNSSTNGVDQNSTSTMQETSKTKNENKGRRSTRRKASSDEPEESSKKKQHTEQSNGAETEEDEKRRNFLERNRIAALKCRQRKKQWLNNLQSKVEYLTHDNEQLQMQTNALREEIVNLKTLLLAHKDCPISQSNGLNQEALQKIMTQPGPLMGTGVGGNHSHQVMQHQPTSQSSFGDVSPTANPSTNTTFTSPVHSLRLQHIPALPTSSSARAMSSLPASNVQTGPMQLSVPGSTTSYSAGQPHPVRIQEDIALQYSDHQPLIHPQQPSNRQTFGPGTTSILRF